MHTYIPERPTSAAPRTANIALNQLNDGQYYSFDMARAYFREAASEANHSESLGDQAVALALAAGYLIPKYVPGRKTEDGYTVRLSQVNNLIGMKPTDLIILIDEASAALRKFLPC